MTGAGSGPGIAWAEARDAATHPTAHGAAHTPLTEDDLVSNFSAAVEKPGTRSYGLRPGLLDIVIGFCPKP